MAKGFGTLIAEVSLAAREARAKKGELCLCPLCGREMDNNGAAWFCRNGREDHEAWLGSRASEAFAAWERGEPVFWADFLHPEWEREWRPDLQGVVLAVCRAPSGRIIEFGTVRGGYGRTNFRVEDFLDTDPGWTPSPEDWKWAEWTGKGE